MTNVIDHDECCSKPFAKASLAGLLDTAEEWLCPKCGTEYRPTIVDGVIRHWQAQVYCYLVRKQ